METSDKTILEEAYEIIKGSRNVEYGSPVENFRRIAEISSLLCGRTIEPSECCKVLISVKLVRESYQHKRDNLVDLCGYADILNRINEEI